MAKSEKKSGRREQLEVERDALARLVDAHEKEICELRDALADLRKRFGLLRFAAEQLVIGLAFDEADAEDQSSTTPLLPGRRSA